MFGWAELSNTGTELVQLGNAMAYEFSAPGAPGNGIIVGTAIPTPEPSTALLLASGLVALAVRRRQIGPRGTL